MWRMLGFEGGYDHRCALPPLTWGAFSAGISNVVNQRISKNVQKYTQNVKNIQNETKMPQNEVKENWLVRFLRGA